ncbi:MFS transporter [Anaerosporomusa subterranea]|uniref:MFS transporter n=1 Tax=Anaerosporomusa subterranea TaxID=1794912 RepID=A0A154BLG4_ANASB|nr:MFS transporter [Anaerosporomusa subterranea]KYZ74731.1 MFS transporter [Anaerosporomusa subterranea]
MSSIANRLSNLPMGKFHWRLLIITMLGWTFDSMDTGIVAFVLAEMIGSWNLTTAQIGYISSIGLVGMASGAFLAGTMADYFGRKKLFAGTLLIYSIATGLCGIAWNYESLLVFRFLVGFGVGGQLPVAVTLVSEYSPAKHRGKMIVILESAWALGWLAASVIAYLVIPKYGWQIAFFIGAAPALMIFYLWRLVPESALYLVNKGKYDEAHALVAKIEQELGIPVGPAPTAAERSLKTQSISFIELWSAPYIKRTICLWILWFGMVYSYYGIFTWLPSLLVKSGHDLIRSFEFLLYMTLAQIPGYFVAAYLVDRLGRKPTLSGFLAACAGCAYMFGNAATSSDILLWGCLLSFFNLGAWGLLYTYTPEMYPTHARGTGVGSAAAFGRVGGILAPIVVGALFTGPDKFATIFAMFTAVLLIIALNVMVLGEETMNRSLEEINQETANK